MFKLPAYTKLKHEDFLINDSARATNRHDKRNFHRVENCCPNGLPCSAALAPRNTGFNRLVDRGRRLQVYLFPFAFDDPSANLSRRLALLVLSIGIIGFL